MKEIAINLEQAPSIINYVTPSNDQHPTTKESPNPNRKIKFDEEILIINKKKQSKLKRLPNLFGTSSATVAGNDNIVVNNFINDNSSPKKINRVLENKLNTQILTSHTPSNSISILNMVNNTEIKSIQNLEKLEIKEQLEKDDRSFWKFL